MIGPSEIRLRNRPRHRGMILFIVSIVIAMVAVGALALLSLLSTEYEATLLRGDEIQAAQLVQSGVEYITCLIDTPVSTLPGDGMSEGVSEPLSDDLPSSLPDLSGGPTSDLTDNPNDLAGSSSFFSTTPSDTPTSHSLYDNPASFRGMPVVADRFARPARGVGRFTVFSPKIEQGRLRGVRFGLVNESTRLHLGAVLQWESESPGQGSRSLMKLPGMTPSIADSILDWIDADKTARPSGAEFEYYERTGVPYRPRNAVPTTLEELLLVRDMTRSLLFGKDASFSYGAKMTDLQLARAAVEDQADLLFQGQIDESSASPAANASSAQPDTPSTQDESSNFFAGSLEDGLTDTSRLDDETGNDSLPWCFLLTTLSAEKLVDPQGHARIFLNDGNIEFLEQQLRQHLDEESTRFIVAWRKDKGKIDDPIDLLDATVTLKTEESKNGEEAKNEKSSEELKSPFTLENAVGEDRFLKLLDYATSSSEVVLSGRINVNEAPGIVLEAVPELDVQTVSKILGRRSASGDTFSVARAPVGGVSGASSENVDSTGRRNDRFRHSVWLLSEKIVDKETMKKLSKRLTTGGDVYRAQIVGYFDGQGTTCRAEVVIDSTVKPPRQIFSKDLTMFGSGFD